MPSHVAFDPPSSSDGKAKERRRSKERRASRERARGSSTPRHRSRSPTYNPMEALKRRSISLASGKLPKAEEKKDKDKHEKDKRKKDGGHAHFHAPTLATAASQLCNRMEIIVESPPNLFIGNTDNSSGALFSGQLRIVVAEEEVALETLEMKLVASVTAKKPVSKDCPECRVKKTELHKWTFLKERKTVQKGQHSFPFSYLLPGHLPATTRGHLGELEYFLEAQATTARKAPNTPSTTTPTYQPADPIILRQPLTITRAIPPLPDKSSIRVFPPTKIAVRATFAPAIHPIGEFNVHMIIENTIEQQKTHMQRWRLRKLTWRLEEKERMVSPACSKHTKKLGGEEKGVEHEETTLIGLEDMKGGWKTDLSDGTVEMEFSIQPAYNVPPNVRPLCDVDSPSGLKISHSLVVELVIAEEWAPLKRPENATPSGAARVLRMQFNIMLTERAGMGIAWDEEQPPMYEDVPASPPTYPPGQGPSGFGAFPPQLDRASDETRSEIVDYTGPPLSPPLPYAEIEALHFDEPPQAEGSAAPYTGNRSWDNRRFDVTDFT